MPNPATASRSYQKPLAGDQLRETPLLGSTTPETVAQRAAINAILRGSAAQPKVIDRADPPVSQPKLTGLRATPVAPSVQAGIEQTPGGDQPLPPKENLTGLPDNLKAGIEDLSGLEMDDVRVYYNSSKPAKLQASAYTQGMEIHVGPGQERHLPHEAWHVVQQKQRRVRPTLQMKAGVSVNDDAGLEREADLMGTRALQQRAGKVAVSHSEALSVNANPHLEAKADRQGEKFVRGEPVTTSSVGVTTKNIPPQNNSPMQLKALQGWTRKDIEEAAGKKTGRSEEYKKIVRLLDLYHKQQLNSEQEAKLLESLLSAAEEWQQKHQGQNSAKVQARKQAIAQLTTSIKQALTTLYPQLTDVQPVQDLIDKNLKSFNNQAVGGLAKKLDYVRYGFGVRRSGNDDKKLSGADFEGYFAENVKKDTFPLTHRGDRTGIPRDYPNFAGRALGMYELDRLLDANLIAPTFRATHENKQGYVMQKIEGVTGDEAENPELDNPLVQQSLSNLYLLDFIAGQVDRHPGNYIVEKDKLGNVRGVKGIDNDLAFAKEYGNYIPEGGTKSILQHLKESPNMKFFVAGKTPYALDRIDRDFAGKILALDEEDVKKALGRRSTKEETVITEEEIELIKQEEIAATIERLVELKKFLQGLVDSNDAKLVDQWQ